MEFENMTVELLSKATNKQLIDIIMSMKAIINNQEKMMNNDKAIIDLQKKIIDRQRGIIERQEILVNGIKKTLEK